MAGFAMGAVEARKPRRVKAEPTAGQPVFVVTGRGWGHGVGMAQ